MAPRNNPLIDQEARRGSVQDDLLSKVPGFGEAEEGSDSNEGDEPSELEPSQDDEQGSDADTREDDEGGDDQGDGEGEAEGGEVDPKTGKKGKPRTKDHARKRFNERELTRRYKKLEGDHNKLKGLTRELINRYNAIKEANTAGQQLGLDHTEQHTAMTVMANYKQNPVETLRYLLTETQAMGYDLSELLGGGTDTSAITSAIDQRLRPITERLSQADKIEAQKRALSGYVDEFVSEKPEGQAFIPVLLGMIEKNPRLDLFSAFYQLENYALRNKMTLKDLHARMNGGQQQRPGNPNNRRPLPGGGRMPATGARNAKEMISVPGGDIGDHTRAAMRELGFDVSKL